MQDFQAKRGGRTVLGPINAPSGEYNHDKGDGLYALELTLGFEKVHPVIVYREALLFNS